MALCVRGRTDSIDYVWQAERSESEMQSSAAAHRETGFDICGSTQLLWGLVGVLGRAGGGEAGGGGGGGGVERDSSELWGEGRDHSVMENYCHNSCTHKQHTGNTQWCVEPANYDNSAPGDMLTLLVESQIAAVSQRSSRKLGL
ncbi:unnamed protein product [Pleuronectes platessa]|uniref:Uncharacterized protein n=1 Tax=Pleuronectes platessa TaxID=8262 RepID=A0A9N7V467_PLEPL|nr:unnamed protein product [Pleuronectes platessa]